MQNLMQNLMPNLIALSTPMHTLLAMYAAHFLTEAQALLWIIGLNAAAPDLFQFYDFIRLWLVDKVKVAAAWSNRWSPLYKICHRFELARNHWMIIFWIDPISLIFHLLPDKLTHIDRREYNFFGFKFSSTWSPAGWISEISLWTLFVTFYFFQILQVNYFIKIFIG